MGSIFVLGARVWCGVAFGVGACFWVTARGARVSVGGIIDVALRAI